MPAALRALRPQEWIKNLLVYAGLVFSGQLGDAGAIADATLAFIAFCAISSAGYLFNDLRDAELDRRHPEKRSRPIPAGELAPETAWAMAAGLAAFALLLPLATVSAGVAGYVGLYAVLTLGYSALLKRVVIIDVMTIAALFLIRVVAGAEAVNASASEFLLLCTAMLALFLGFTKRRQEAIAEQSWAAAANPGPEASNRSSPAGGSSGVTRPVLEHYSIPFLDQMVAMVTAAAIISYAIYAASSPLIGSEMLATVPPVLYGVFRYLYLIYDRNDTRSTAAILTEDPGMVGAALAWAGIALVMLYVVN